MADFTWPDCLPAGAEPPPREPEEFAQADATRDHQLNDPYLAGRSQILDAGESAYFRATNF